MYIAIKLVRPLTRLLESSRIAYSAGIEIDFLLVWHGFLDFLYKRVFITVSRVLLRGDTSCFFLTHIRSHHNPEMAKCHQKYILPKIVFTVAVFYSVKLSFASSSVQNDFNGIYLIANLDTKKLETAFCHFRTNV